jgi:hypothetical protein
VRTVEQVGFDKNTTVKDADFLIENALEIAPPLVNLKISEHWADCDLSPPTVCRFWARFPKSKICLSLRRITATEFCSRRKRRKS